MYSTGTVLFTRATFNVYIRCHRIITQVNDKTKEKGSTIYMFLYLEIFKIVLIYIYKYMERNKIKLNELNK